MKIQDGDRFITSLTQQHSSPHSKTSMRTLIELKNISYEVFLHLGGHLDKTNSAAVHLNKSVTPLIDLSRFQTARGDVPGLWGQFGTLFQHDCTPVQ